MAMIGGSNEAGPGGGVSAGAQGGGGGEFAAFNEPGMFNNVADFVDRSGGPLGFYDAVNPILNSIVNFGQGFDYKSAGTGASIGLALGLPYGASPVTSFLGGVIGGLFGPNRRMSGPKTKPPGAPEPGGFDEEGRGREFEGEIARLIGGEGEDEGFGSITPGPTAGGSKRKKEKGRGPAALSLSGDLESTTKKYFKGTGSNKLAQGLVFDESEFTKKLF